MPGPFPKRNAPGELKRYSFKVIKGFKKRAAALEVSSPAPPENSLILESKKESLYKNEPKIKKRKSKRDRYFLKKEVNLNPSNVEKKKRINPVPEKDSKKPRKNRK